MVTTDEDFAILNVAEEKLAKIKAAVREFEEDPTAKIEDLAAKHDLPRRSLYHYFKQLGLSTVRGKGMSMTERTVRKTELSALSDEAEKITTIAFGIGSPIARRFLPFINHLLGQGRTLEMIAVDLMSWYEMKITTEANIAKLKTENQLLKQEKGALRLKLEEAWAVASPNFRYLLRAKLLDDFGNKILKWMAHGARVGRNQYEGYRNMLKDLDEDIGGVTFVRVTISPEKIVALQKKHKVGSHLIRLICNKKEIE